MTGDFLQDAEIEGPLHHLADLAQKERGPPPKRGAKRSTPLMSPTVRGSTLRSPKVEFVLQAGKHAGVRTRNRRQPRGGEARLNLQVAYDLEVATRISVDRILRDAHPREAA